MIFIPRYINDSPYINLWNRDKELRDKCYKLAQKEYITIIKDIAFIINNKTWRNQYIENVFHRTETTKKLVGLIILEWLEDIEAELKEKNLTMQEFKNEFEKKEKDKYTNNILYMYYMFSFCAFIVLLVTLITLLDITADPIPYNRLYYSFSIWITLIIIYTFVLKYKKSKAFINYWKK